MGKRRRSGLTIDVTDLAKLLRPSDVPIDAHPHVEFQDSGDQRDPTPLAIRITWGWEEGK